MALEIHWSKRALHNFDILLEYLESEWTHYEILNLEATINQLEKTIYNFSENFPRATNNPLLRKALIDKNNYIIYKVDLNNICIDIINFRGTQQLPK